MFKIRTTTPLYHPPIATIVVVAVSLLLGIVALAAGPKAVTDYTLAYDDGLKPIQWLTSAFIQTSWLYLFVDLVFLFAFGFLAEGKMGAAKFIALFLCISVGSSAIEQTVMKGKEKVKAPAPVAPDAPTEYTGQISGGEADAFFEERMRRRRTIAGRMGIDGSVGASTTIFGLMAVCMLFAPSAVYQFGKDDSGATFPLVGFAVVFILWEGAKWFMIGFEKGGLPVHLLGLIPGIVLGVLAIKLKLARCDGEDLLSGGGSGAQSSVPTKKSSKSPKESSAERRKKEADLRRDRAEAAKEKERLIREAKLDERTAAPKIETTDPVVIKAQEALGAGESIEAIKLLRRITDPKHLKQFSLSDYMSLFQATATKGQLQAAAIVLDKSIAGHPEDANERCLKYSRILLRFKEYEKCQSILAKVQRKSLTPEQQSLYRQLVIQLRQSE